MTTYCGNNSNFPGLLNGTHNIGTNRDCLRKGVGLGRSLPYDKNYDEQFLPIDQRKIYCGDGNVLPQGYDYYGNPPMCLQKGVGIGKASKVKPKALYFIRYGLPVVIGVFLSGVIFVVLYFSKAKFVSKIVNKKSRIDWVKFIPYWLLFSLVIWLIIIFVWIFGVRRRV